MGLKIKFFIVSFFLLGSLYSVYSQSNILNATDPTQIGERSQYEKDADPDTPLEYGRVDDRDILFSKMIWEEIDVSQRVNFPYLYPIDSTVVGKDRRPLIHHIREITKRDGNDSISLYEDENGEFNRPMNKMAREKIWKAYILDDQGTEFTDDPYNSIRNAVIDGDLKWPLNVPATSHPEKSDASDVFLKKDIDGNYIPREITEAEFENYFNLEDDETGSLDVNGNLMSEEDQTEMRSILREIIIDVYFEEGIHYQWERFEWEDVVSWKIKGLWYFDNIQSQLKYRIIGIAPVTIPVGLIQQDESTQDITINDDSDESSDEPLCEDEFGNEVPCEEDDVTDSAEPEAEEIAEDNVEEEVEESLEVEESIAINPESQAKPLFWIFYPDVRKDLAKAYVFSERNSAVRKSFDELINKRRFEAIIYREANVYEDRDLFEMFPRNSFMRLIESERIKEKIRNLEHDMWSW